MKQSDLPTRIEDPSEAEEMSDAFNEAEADWYRSQGLMDHPQFWLHGDSYDDNNDYLAILKKERVLSFPRFLSIFGFVCIIHF